METLEIKISIIVSSNIINSAKKGMPEFLVTNGLLTDRSAEESVHRIFSRVLWEKSWKS